MNYKKIWNYYNGLFLSPDVDRLRKLLVRYELYKKSSKVPGDIVECGVFKGTGMFQWLKFISIYESSSTKRVIGFDFFNVFKKTKSKIENKSIKKFVSESNFKGTSLKDLKNLTKKMGLENKAKFIKGDIKKTIKDFVKKNKGMRISLINLDLDVEDATSAALKYLWPLVSKGGIVICDEYGMPGWGESDAIDKYFSKRKDYVFKKIKFSIKPTLSIVKK